MRWLLIIITVALMIYTVYWSYKKHVINPVKKEQEEGEQLREFK